MIVVSDLNGPVIEMTSHKVRPTQQDNEMLVIIKKTKTKIMAERFKSGRLTVTLAVSKGSNKIIYMLYPMNVDENMAEEIACRYQVNVAVISGMDWENDMTPWNAPGVPKGEPPFLGKAGEFLTIMRNNVLPDTEKRTDAGLKAERTLLGVSLSGLFAVWQWAVCDQFDNIISLSGSFWYEGFTDWFSEQDLTDKKGKVFMLLGSREGNTPIPEFRDIASDTAKILSIMRSDGVDVEFHSVPGNHYQYADERLRLALNAMFCNNSR